MNLSQVELDYNRWAENEVLFSNALLDWFEENEGYLDHIIKTQT